MGMENWWLILLWTWGLSALKQQRMPFLRLSSSWHTLGKQVIASWPRTLLFSDNRVAQSQHIETDKFGAYHNGDKLRISQPSFTVT